MKPVCTFCGARLRNVPCEVTIWKCSLCMTKQKHECSCELCTQVEEIVEEKFIDDIVEFKPYFELGE